MSVLILANTSKPAAIDAAHELKHFLASRSLDALILANEDCARDACDLGVFRFAVALGGDGTILKAAQLLHGSGIPLLGVRFGRLGFLAGCSSEDMISAVSSLIDGHARIEKRSALAIEARGDDFEILDLFAFNEAVVARGSSGRIITYEITIDQKLIAKMRGDGVLVATATGSTGYALSAGGPLVAPGFKGLVVVPITPHTLNARAIMTDPDDVVTLSLVEGKGDEGDLFIDGNRFELPGPLKEVRVQKSEDDVLLVKAADDFYSSVASVFFGRSDA